jgi:hypothetical protein
VARLFNAYIIVDWSTASKPGTGSDSVLIGVMKRDVRFRLTFESFAPATRAEAEKRVLGVLDDLKKKGENALLAVEFPLGFPRGLAAGLKLNGAPWSAVWDQIDKMVKDKADNTNNRFAVGSEINRRLTDGPFPFWGCPPRDTLTTLQPKRQRDHGPDDVPEFRQTDIAAKAASPWKLYYAGAVGGHAILGIPMVRRLKKARGDAVKVWPFETGFRAPSSSIVYAEVWPTLAKAAWEAAVEVKDQRQVRATAAWLSELDSTGTLAALFDRPPGLSDGAAAAAVDEEGWILGIG